MQDFMKDRYGADELTCTLGLGGMVLALIGTLADLRPLSWIAIVIVILALLRAFSKNIDARQRENGLFKSAVAKVPGLGSLVDKFGSVGSGAYRAGSGQRPAPTQADVERAKRTAKKMWSERKTSKFIKCPTCGQMLSVPKGKGRIRVTCPKCRTKMETRS